MTTKMEASLELRARCSMLVDAICHRLEVALLPVERKYLIDVVLDFPGQWRTATAGELEAAVAGADLDVEQGDLMYAWMNRYLEMFRGVVVLQMILHAVGNPRRRGELVQQVYMRVGQVVYMLDAGVRAAG